LGLVELRRPTVYQIEVHPTIIVVVNESAAGAQCLWKIVLGRHGIFVCPDNAAAVGRNLFENLGYGKPR
jgi:hypothetical protein